MDFNKLNVPKRLKPHFSLKSPNKRIIVFKGSFEIQEENSKTWMFKGIIYFEWHIRPCLGFKGESIELDENLLDIHKPTLHFDGNTLNNLIILNQATTSKGNSSITIIKGKCFGHSVIGNQKTEIDGLKFIVPNFLEVFGAATKNKINNKSYNVSLTRLVFDCGEYEIIMERHVNSRDRIQLLKEKGGFLDTHYGHIRKKDLTKFTLQDLTRKDIEILRCFNSFLSFLNGRKTCIMLPTGYDGTKVQFIDYTNYLIDPYKDVVRWSPDKEYKDLEELWKCFHSLYGTDENSKEAIDDIIHFYTLANGNYGLIEVSTLIAQSALEILFNWWFIEMLSEPNSNNNAENKITRIAEKIGIPEDELLELTELNNFILVDPTTDNPFRAIVEIRNSITHGKKIKREKLMRIPSKIRVECWQLSILMIELGLLKAIGYLGHYFSRIEKNHYKEEKLVPWHPNGKNKYI
jgi:hypothetical protein